MEVKQCFKRFQRCSKVVSRDFKGALAANTQRRNFYDFSAPQISLLGTLSFSVAPAVGIAVGHRSGSRLVTVQSDSQVQVS